MANRGYKSMDFKNESKSLLLNDGVEAYVKGYKETQRKAYCSGEQTAKNKKDKNSTKFCKFCKKFKKIKKTFFCKKWVKMGKNQQRAIYLHKKPHIRG